MSISDKLIPIFHRRIFWDIDFNQLDYDGKAAYVITRVFNRLMQSWAGDLRRTSTILLSSCVIMIW